MNAEQTSPSDQETDRGRRSRLGRITDIIVDVVLLLIGFLGIIAVGVFVMVSFFGFSLYSFSSGSMEPEIPVGSVSLSREIEDPETIEVDDIITVNHPERDEPLTHRVTAVNDDDSVDRAVEEGASYHVITEDNDFLHTLTGGMLGDGTIVENSEVQATHDAVDAGDMVVLNLKGDANDEEDSRVYVVGSNTADEYMFHAVGLSAALHWVTANFWWVVLGFWVLLIQVMMRPSQPKSVPKNR